jgi:hypothetical protein
VRATELSGKGVGRPRPEIYDRQEDVAVKKPAPALPGPVAMNLALYTAALWRHRILLASGLFLAALFAVFSYVAPIVTDQGFTVRYRESETWTSTATVFVTQKGFPWGRTYLLSTTPSEGAPATTLGDPGRFASLAILYTELANSDQVRGIMRTHGPVRATLQAVTVVPPVDSPPLPLIRLVATSNSGADAYSGARRYTEAFQESLRIQQQEARIPPDQRVIIKVTQRAEDPVLQSGRSKVMPLMVFIVVMFAVVALALVLDNLRSRIRKPWVEAGPAPGPAPAAAADS